MRGLLLPGVVFLVLCVNYISAQWPNSVLTKGVTCEDRCKKIKNCDPLNEFSACKCFPEQYVKKWLQYNTLPMEPHLVCLMSWHGVVPKCCDMIYKKEKDSYKNCESENDELKKSYDAEIDELKKNYGAEIDELKKNYGAEIDELKNGHGAEIDELKNGHGAEIDELKKSYGAERDELKKSYGAERDELKNIHGAERDELKNSYGVEIDELKNGHGAEIEEFKTKNEQLQKKLGSYEQDGGDRTSNLTAEMLVIILEQNFNQTQDMEELKKRLDAQEDASERLTEHNSNQSQVIEQLEKRLDNEQEKSGQLEKRLTAVEDASERLSEQNSNHSQVIAQLEGRLDYGEEDGERLAQLTAGMANSITAQNQELQNLTQAWSSEPWKPFATELVQSIRPPSAIGFFAFLIQKSKFPVTAVVKFEKVVTNNGGGYDPSTGKFTCPEDGTYLFTFTITMVTNGYEAASGGVFINDEVKEKDFYIVVGTTTSITTTKTYLFRLNKGDCVMLKILSKDYTVIGSKRTSFAGFLVYK